MMPVGNVSNTMNERHRIVGGGTVLRQLTVQRFVPMSKDRQGGDSPGDFQTEYDLLSHVQLAS